MYDVENIPVLTNSRPIFMVIYNACMSDPNQRERTNNRSTTLLLVLDTSTTIILQSQNPYTETLAVLRYLCYSNPHLNLWR